MSFKHCITFSSVEHKSIYTLIPSCSFPYNKNEWWLWLLIRFSVNNLNNRLFLTHICSPIHWISWNMLQIDWLIHLYVLEFDSPWSPFTFIAFEIKSCNFETALGWVNDHNFDFWVRFLLPRSSCPGCWFEHLFWQISFAFLRFWRPDRGCVCYLILVQWYSIFVKCLLSCTAEMEKYLFANTLGYVCSYTTDRLI